MKTRVFRGNPEFFDIDRYLAATTGLIRCHVS